MVMKCCLCGEDIDIGWQGWEEGHNAQPLKKGRCCTKCNSKKVIPARIRGVGGW